MRIEPPDPDWHATGGGQPTLSGSYSQPPGGHGDARSRVLLARAVAMLYSCVGSAQQADTSDDALEHAVHQMLVTSAALAAGEADAALTLLSQGLEGPSLIHIRSLGEMVIRAILCVERPDLAKQLYDTWRPTWEKMISKHLPDVVIDGLSEQSQKDMRALESQPTFKAAYKAISERDNLLQSHEWDSWSKRTHGDIFALVRIAVNLRERTDGDIRKPIVAEQPYGQVAEILFNRTIGFGLMMIGTIAKRFGIGVEEQALNELAAEYGSMQARSAKNPVRS